MAIILVTLVLPYLLTTVNVLCQSTMKNSDVVAIFWDYENCPVPSNASGYAIANSICALARPFGCVKFFSAYLEITEQLSISKSFTVRSELQSSGVCLVDCPHNGRKEVADKMILVDMLAYALDNPAPSTIVLITGDRDFAYAFSVLKLRRYRTILVTLPNAHASLTFQASICFDWYRDVVNSAIPNLQAGHNLGQTIECQRPTDAACIPSSLKLATRDENTSAHSFSTGENVDIMQCLRNRPQQQMTFSYPTHAPGDSYTCTPVSTSADRETAIVNDAADDCKFSFTYNALIAVTTGNTSSCSSEFQQESIIEPKNTGSDINIVEQDYLYDSVPTTSVSSSSWSAERATLSLLPSFSGEPAETWHDHQRTTPSNVLPTVYIPLVRSLQTHISQGRSQVFRSKIGEDLRHENVYQEAGVRKFKEYIALAESDGVVRLGGSGGYEWVSLHPKWRRVVL